MNAVPFEKIDDRYRDMYDGGSSSSNNETDIIDSGDSDNVVWTDVLDGGSAFDDVSTITVDANCSKIVLYTGNKYLIPCFNEFISSSDRCTLSETPCGGIKNSNVSDLMPGAVSISGDGCYLKTVAGTYTGKSLGAGKLAENKDIVTSGATGHSLYTADGEEVLTADGQSVLVTPPYMIVSEFYVQNITETVTTATINIRCPDSVSLFKLYNIDTAVYESVTFSQVTQTSGTVNSYSFTRSIPAKTEVHLQIMVTYTSLAYTFKFSNDAVQAAGLHNAESWLAYYDSVDTDINFFLFTKTPDFITCNIDSSGNVTQFSFPLPNGVLYRGSVAYAAPSRTTSGEIPDCMNYIIPGSLSRFLNGFSAVSTSTAAITSYVVPPISDNKILPKSTISSSYISSTLTKRMSPGEYSCLSFVLNSDKAVNLSIIASNLVSGSNTIAASNIDLKYVKCWWQGGNSSRSTHNLGRFLTPELLLNDDTLVQAWGDTWSSLTVNNPAGKNYLKLNTGEYIHISDGSTQGDVTSQLISIADRPVYDADYLQILNLPAAYNKQVWVTLHVPTGTPAGTYTGTITVRSDFTVLKTLTLSLQVLPITLGAPSKAYSIYYRGKLAADDVGTIGSEIKSQAQFLAEHLDMAKHGITHPILMTHNATTLPVALGIRSQCGISNTTLFYYGTINIDDSIADIQTWKNTCVANGVSQLYIYGQDESNMSSLTSKMTEIHNIGVKIFCAQSPTYALAVKDYLDLAIGGSAFTAAQIAEFRATGHKIYSYANPQTVPEFPNTFRMNYGLNLWQKGYDGAMDYAYQHAMQDIWNDFDSYAYRDHNFTYPTANGVIDTIQFEGYREACNDIKYLDALQAAITAHPGSTATTASNWLTTLKSTDLTTVNLDEVREQMITYILALQGA